MGEAIQKAEEEMSRLITELMSAQRDAAAIPNDYGAYLTSLLEQGE